MAGSSSECFGYDKVKQQSFPEHRGSGTTRKGTGPRGPMKEYSHMCTDSLLAVVPQGHGPLTVDLGHTGLKNIFSRVLQGRVCVHLCARTSILSQEFNYGCG